MKLEAWGRRHNAHGFHIDDLVWCPVGEGPDSSPGDWVRAETMIRMDQFDIVVPDDSDKGVW